MTYAMSMLSKVMTDTVRTDMVTNRINMSTRAGVSKAMRLATKLKHRGALRDEAATTQMRGAMKIAAQSVVAYLPIVRCAPLRPDARASGRGAYCSSIRRRRAFVRSIWRWYSVSRATL